MLGKTIKLPPLPLVRKRTRHAQPLSVVIVLAYGYVEVPLASRFDNALFLPYKIKHGENDNGGQEGNRRGRHGTDPVHEGGMGLHDLVTLQPQGKARLPSPKTTCASSCRRKLFSLPGRQSPEGLLRRSSIRR